MPNLCGVNQKLLAEALSSVKRGVYIFLFVSAPYTFLSCPGTTSGASTPAELHISMMQPSRPLKNRDQWFLYLVDTIIVHRPSFPPATTQPFLIYLFFWIPYVWSTFSLPWCVTQNAIQFKDQSNVPCQARCRVTTWCCLSALLALLMYMSCQICKWYLTL